MNVTKNILVYMTHPHVQVWNFLPIHKQILEERVPGSRVTICSNSKEFLDRLSDAQMAIVWFFKEEWLEQTPNLEYIATPAAGSDWINLPASSASKVVVSHGSFHGPMIAESVVGAIFYFLKAFNFSKKMQSRKKWARMMVADKLRSLKGSRVTVLGFGKIGQSIGKFLKPFGCTITGIKRTSSEAPGYFTEGDRIVTADKISEVFAVTDHLILALPGGAETKGLITQELLEKLPASCYLYNVGRGNVYNEQDLVASLENRKLAGAYLDVFAVEPLPEESRLWEMENVLIQPHLSAASPQYLELFVEELAEKINNGKNILY